MTPDSLATPMDTEQRPKIVLAIDSFKGCLTSAEANQAAAEAIREHCPQAEVVQIPMSDGGEGWLEAFHSAIGGEVVALTVCDPLMRPTTARYLVKGQTAVVEIAQACGLTLLKSSELNPLLATSYGVGQMVADAVRRGCRHIIVGLGGSATSDCGRGMLQAVIDQFAPKGTWDEVRALTHVRFTIATDVTSPLCGEQGAAHIFAPQKGATPDMVRQLESRARQFAAASALRFGFDRQDAPGAGAAGGLGYAFMQYLGAQCRPGADVLFEALGFDNLLSGAALVVTGEGSADRQTLMGKLPYAILRQAHKQGIPTWLIAGRVADRQVLLEAGFSQVVSINPPGLTPSEAMKPEVARRNIRATLSLLTYSLTFFLTGRDSFCKRSSAVTT